MISIKHTAKKLVAVSTLASVVAFASLSFAQEQNAAKHCQTKGPQRLFTALDVQDSQKEGFHSIMQAQHDKKKALHKQYSESREQEKAAMETLHTSTLESLSAILNEQQLENFKAITLHNRPAKGAGSMKGPQRMAKHDRKKGSHKEQGKKASEHMIATLELSDDKADAFRDIMKAQGEQRHEVRDQYKAAHQAEHEAMKALFEDTLVQLESILSDQQIDNLKAIKKHNRRV
jgi:Spy/CpxP family protein refolding chaperone